MAAGPAKMYSKYVEYMFMAAEPAHIYAKLTCYKKYEPAKT